MMVECVKDFDCPGNLVCFDDVSWSKVAGSNGSASFCDCDGFYGWVGEDCDEIGPQTIFWCVASIAVALLSILGLLKFGLSPLPVVLSKRYRRWSALTETFIFVNMYFFFRTIVSVLFIINVLDRDGYGDPSKNELQFAPAPMPTVGVPDKRGSLTTYTQGFLAIMHIFNILASTNIALVWCDVAFKAKNLLMRNSPKFMRFRVFIRVVQVLYLVLYTLNSYMLDDANIWLVLLVLRLVLAVTFLLAAKWFKDLSGNFSVKDQARTSQSIGTVFHRIYKAIYLIIGALAVLTICSVTVVIMSFNASNVRIPGREMLQPGKINPAPVLYVLLMFSYTFIAFVIGWYISTVLHAYYSSKQITNEKVDFAKLSSAPFTASNNAPLTSNDAFEYSL